MTTENLLPCPFCANEPSLFSHGLGNFSVLCQYCGCTHNQMNGKSRAIDAWNTRAPIVNAPVGEVGDDELISVIHKYVHHYHAPNYPKMHDQDKANYIGAVKALRTSGHLKDASGLASALEMCRKELLLFKSEANCEHEVGICWCPYFNALEAANSALKQYQESGE